MISHWTYLLLLAPQIVVAPRDPSEVVAGNTVLLTCVAQGDSPPHVVWNRENKVLENGSRVVISEDVIVENGLTFVQSILEICSTEETDSGQYSCVTTLDAVQGNSTASFGLTVDLVNGKPNLKQILYK